MSEKKNEKNLEAAEKVAKAVKEKKKPEAKKDGKPGFFAKLGEGWKRFFKNLKGEIKKIVWPDFKTVIKNTGIVIAAVIVIGAFIWIIDFALTKSIDGMKHIADAKAETSVTEQADEEAISEKSAAGEQVSIVPSGPGEVEVQTKAAEPTTK